MKYIVPVFFSINFIPKKVLNKLELKNINWQRAKSKMQNPKLENAYKFYHHFIAVIFETNDNLSRVKSAPISNLRNT